MPDYYNYNSKNGNTPPGGPHRGGGDDIGLWIPVIIALVLFWPVGLVLLFRKLMGYSGTQKRYRGSGAGYYRAQANYARQQGAPYAQSSTQSAGQTQSGQTAGQTQPGQTAGTPPPKAQSAQSFHHYAPVSKKEIKRRRKEAKRAGTPSGKGLVIGGSIVAGTFGLGAMAMLVEGFSYGWWSEQIIGVLFFLSFFGVGAVMAAAGILRGRKGKRYRRYLGYIGRRDSLSLHSLAEAMGVRYSKVCTDLQDMLDLGILPRGFIDYQQSRLILSEEGLHERESVKPAAAEKKPSSDDEVLLEIKRINDLIPDPDMSAKIDRIGTITGKILAYQRNNPTKAGQLRQFLNYYLPTTLKILRAYARLDAQGVQGDNITGAKDRIEGMMDKVVEGFEKQLDRLFQNDAMDITTDVAVLEQMIERDGLSGGSAMTSSFGL